MESKMEKGFYVLKQTVTNPKPDRRSKLMHSVPEWEKGMRVFVVPGTAIRRGTISFNDSTQVYYGGSDSEVDVGDVLIPHLEKAEFAIGQPFRDPTIQAQMADVLALAFERRLLNTEQIFALAGDIDQMDEEAYAAFRKKHWLPR